MTGRPSLWDIFAVFAKVGAFTIGGGYAMVLIIEKEVTGRGWISKEEFPDILALAQTAPGLLAVNISIFAGYRMRGAKGAAVATLGSCIAPFAIILAIAMFFSGYQDNPYVIKAFKGMRPAVVALIAVPMIKMARKCNHSWWAWLVTAAAMCLVAFMNVSPFYILIVTILIALSVSVALERKRKEGER
ncbi:MAG: chromate transporter [Bacteroidia bacterium]|nr:chromate transporter [Bacteroidia bacterium]